MRPASGDDVGCQKVFQIADPVTQNEFALLQPLDLQPVGHGHALQRVDGGVEIAMLLPQPVEFLQRLVLFDLGQCHRPAACRDATPLRSALTLCRPSLPPGKAAEGRTTATLRHCAVTFRDFTLPDYASD